MKKKLNKCNLLSIFFIFLLLFISMPTAINAQSDFLEYINKDKFKHYKNGLFLGMFESQENAEEFLTKNIFNPATLEKYDVAFAFGTSGKNPWVMLWETTRVMSDNLSWSPLTN